MNPQARTHPLTPLQTKVLAYLVKFLQVNDQLPTCAKIAEDFGWASANSALEHLQKLEKNGHLRRNELGNLMLSHRPIIWAGLCVWRGGDETGQAWQTGCGHDAGYIEGGPTENDMHHCPFCGGALYELIGMDLARGESVNSLPMEVAHG